MMNWKYNHPLQNIFSWCMALLLIAGAASLLYWDRINIFMMLNHRHSDIGDLILKYYTYAGEGLIMVALGVILLGLGKRKLGVLMILSFLLSGLLAQTIKRIEPKERPGLYFKKEVLVHSVDGHLLKGRNSFPSGHTTTAFAMFSLLAFAVRSRELQFLFFMMALLVGYSRIFLGQHFFEDALAGAAIGFAASWLLFWLFRNKEWD
jgi:membrane-associated phospholipid phosphatase